MVNVYHSDVIAERRRFPRKPLNLSLKFELIEKTNSSLPESNAQSKLETTNISAGGLALYSQSKLEKGQELNLVLYLPPKEKRSADLTVPSWIESECIPINIHANIAWRLPYINNKYAYGVEFVAVEPDDQAEFDDFLKEFYLHKPSIIGE